MISDSLLRRLPDDAIKDCSIVARLGKTFRTLRRELENGLVSIKDFEVIGLLIGTNDVSDLVFCRYGMVGYREKLKWCPAPRQEVTWEVVNENFGRLMGAVRDLNHTAVLVISGIIPRPGDWQLSREWCVALSDWMQQWCCEQQRLGKPVIFSPTYKFFSEGRHTST